MKNSLVLFGISVGCQIRAALRAGGRGRVWGCVSITMHCSSITGHMIRTCFKRPLSCHGTEEPQVSRSAISDHTPSTAHTHTPSTAHTHTRTHTHTPSTACVSHIPSLSHVNNVSLSLFRTHRHTHTHTHTDTHTHTKYTRTRTNTHTRNTHVHTDMSVHTHTHT